MLEIEKVAQGMFKSDDWNRLSDQLSSTRTADVSSNQFASSSRHSTTAKIWARQRKKNKNIKHAPRGQMTNRGTRRQCCGVTDEIGHDLRIAFFHFSKIAFLHSPSLESEEMSRTGRGRQAPLPSMTMKTTAAETNKFNVFSTVSLPPCPWELHSRGPSPWLSLLLSHYILHLTSMPPPTVASTCPTCIGVGLGTIVAKNANVSSPIH